MQQTIDDGIASYARLKVATEQIDQMLDGIIGKRFKAARTEWSSIGTRENPALYLSLWFEDQASCESIFLKELDDPAKLRSKLRWVWDDLLKVMIDRSLDKIDMMMKEEVGS